LREYISTSRLVSRLKVLSSQLTADDIEKIEDERKKVAQNQPAKPIKPMDQKKAKEVAEVLEKSSVPSNSVAHPEIESVEIIEDTPTSTRIKEGIEVSRRISRTPPPTKSFEGGHRESSPEYSDALLKEKYGPSRGEQMYDSMIGSNKPGLHFVVDQKIIDEKRTMMNALGKSGPHTNHHYQGLYKLWAQKFFPDKVQKKEVASFLSEMKSFLLGSNLMK